MNQLAYLGWSQSVLHSTRDFNVILKCFLLLNHFPTFSFISVTKQLRLIILATCLYLQLTIGFVFRGLTTDGKNFQFKQEQSRVEGKRG